MRVLHVGKFFPPFAGGIEHYSGDLIDALGRRGVDCHALVHSHPIAAGAAVPQANVTRSRTWFELAFTPISPGFPVQLQRLIRRWKPDLLHFHLPNPSAFWALMLPAARRLPWLAHWHADVVSSEHDQRLRWLYPLYRPFERRLLQRSAAIVATSPAYAESSVPLRPHQERVTVIPLGVDPTRLEPAGSAPPWPQPSLLRLLTIGRLTYYKGIEVLIEALHGLPQAQLLIVGDGQRRTALQALVDRHELTDRVRLLGALSDAERNALLRECDVFCLPSIERTEAFGLVLLEAMHAAKPVIATAIAGSGVPWVVQQGGNGLVVEPGSAAALSDAIEQVSDARLRQRLAARARQAFTTQFSIEHSARDCQALYQKLLARD